MASTDAIVERNRRNAIKSTGPKTDQGKAIARRNAVRHGLTAADPTMFGVEEGSLFRSLHEQLVEELSPRSLVEAGLVHRIALCLWRLRRATLIDGAYSANRANRVPRSHEQTQCWIDRFNDLWRWEEVQDRDKKKVKWARAVGFIGREDQSWIRLKRPRLCLLDELRQDMLEEVEGIDALWTILHHLWDKCTRRVDQHLLEADIEKLAFVLGDSAETFPVNYNETRIGGSQTAYKAIREFLPRPGHMQELLWKGLATDCGQALTPEIESALRACLDTLEQQRMAMESPLDDEDHLRRQQLAVLPSAGTLDRLTRYETHAERGLYRALDQLSRMKGVTIHVLAARLSMAEAPPAS
jgi:hypothetical protein